MSANITLDQAVEIGNSINVDWGEINPEEYRKGLEVEQEHATVAEGDFMVMGQIALDHLKEIPDYYTRLLAMEDEAKGMGERVVLKPGQKLLTEGGEEIETEEGDCLLEGTEEILEEDILEENVLRDITVKVKDFILKKAQKVSAWGKDIILDVMKVDVDSDTEVKSLILFPDKDRDYSKMKKGISLVVSGTVNDGVMRPVEVKF